MADWITSFITEGGYLAIALLMALENIFPPVPSELIMPFAGAVAARGDLNFVLVVIAGSIGSLLGTLPWYWAGAKLGAKRLERWADRHGRWLTITGDDLQRADRWFDRHGSWAVAAGRLVPALRTVISAPAGIMGMPFGRFLLWSALGTVVWTSALAGIGQMLGDRYDEISHWLDPITIVIIAGAVIGWLWRVIRFQPSHASRPSSARRGPAR
jgi:membrane protein DedA with SNARE-associated domain